MAWDIFGLTLDVGGGNTIPPTCVLKLCTSDIAAELTATTGSAVSAKPRYGGAAPPKKYKQCWMANIPCACYLLSVHLNGVVSTPKWCLSVYLNGYFLTADYS